MDLEPGWEKKALIILAIITIIIVVYAYGPFKSDVKAEVQNNTSVDPIPASTPPSTVSNNTTNPTISNVNVTGGTNGTFQITLDQAKKIASQPGLTAGQPTKGTVVSNNNNIPVWIVPLMKGNVVAKRIYVDGATGVIVGSEEVKN
ncbi:MAG: peptidase [Methanobacterium sp.]